ncbi:cytochrome P450 [Biscogniauxia mediterranea]|nr:cytochrome P450 [Biscogniauxia mediterranea]
MTTILDGTLPTGRFTLLQVLIGAISLGVGYILYTVVYNIFFHPLRKYPGPKLWAISKVPFAVLFVSGNAHKKVKELHDKYGDIVRVGPNHLSFLGPQAWRELIGHKKAGESENGKVPGFFSGGPESSVIQIERQAHAWQRRLLAHGFSAQALQAQEGIIKYYVDLLMLRLRERCDEGRATLDAVRWFNYTTFDIVGDLAFGEAFGSLEKATYNPWVEFIFELFKYGAFNWMFMRMPVPTTLGRMMIPKSLQQKITTHNSLIQETLKKRMSQDSERPDFIYYMTRKHREGYLSRDEVESNASVFVVAGSETTATALSGLVFFLGTNPAVKEKVTNEVRTAFQSEDRITINSVQSLRYLNAVIEEGLRLFPPVPCGAPRLTPPEGTTAFSEYIPGNTTLEIWHWPMFRNPKYFTQADEFIPERWLGDPRYNGDRLDMVQAFSFGPRNCLGKNLAWAELRLILARLIWNFDFELAEDSYDWMENIEVYTIYDKPKLNVHYIPRKFE